METTTYFDSVLSLAAPSSENVFVAIGYQMWLIWEKVLQFRHGQHRFLRADVGPVAAALNDTVPSADSLREESSKLQSDNLVPLKSSLQWRFAPLAPPNPLWIAASSLSGLVS
jgi:hypothetical protein